MKQPTTSIEKLWAKRSHTSCRKQLWRLLRQFQTPFEFAAEFDETLVTHWNTPILHGAEKERAVKLVLRNSAGQECETVLLLPSARNGAKQRATVCVSSQPGCGVGCIFCATGKLGYRGDFTAEQICEQVYWAGIEATKLKRHLRNVVFMGMGEPLHNSQQVVEAIERLIGEPGFGFSPHRITVSTVGVPSEMVRFAQMYPGVNIALSLHSAIPQRRRELVPRAVGDLSMLQNAIREVNRLQPTKPVWLEYVLLSGINDGSKDQQALLGFCKGLRVELNLIPYNSVANSPHFQPTVKNKREAFASILRRAGIRTTIRKSFGSNQAAACGQLAGSTQV